MKKKKIIKVKVKISTYGRPFQIVLKHKLQQKGHTANYTRERKKGDINICMLARKMISLINKSADWSPLNSRKTARMFFFPNLEETPN